MLAEIFGPDMAILAIVVVVLLLGGSQIPKLARALGSARREFDEGLTESSPTPTSGA